MSQFQVPRQVTTRLEFMPGFGLRELLAVIAGLVLGYGLHKLADALHVSLLFSLTLLFGPPAIVYFACMGGENSLLMLVARARRFGRSAKRFLYRVGTGRQSAAARQEPAARPGPLQAILLGLRTLTGQPAQVPQAQAPAGSSVQAWLPLEDVQLGMLKRRDGLGVVAMRVEPVNLGLKSPTEQQRIIQALHEAINALQQPAQILSVPRPLDLDHYVEHLQTRLQQLDSAREHLLRPYIHHVRKLVAEGEAQERRFYILLPLSLGRGEGALQHAHDLVARLRQADLNPVVLQDEELLDLLHVWSHPGHAAFERAPVGVPSMTTLVEVDS